MSNERLTRQEISWLLAQEARGAAKALREGVVRKQRAPEIRDATGGEVETTLDMLDDAIGMLSALQSGPQGKARRGRIDLAALLVQVAPNARIVMEPGAGTEVFGEETDLHRMLHMLVSQTHSDPAATGDTAAPDVQIRRQDDWVKVSVALGPDTSATTDLERRWLSRMAVRHGGRLELEGGMQSLLLPADGASDQREVFELRKELEQAQQLGEAYARELAAVFSAGDLPSEPPMSPTSESAAERFDLLLGTASAMVRAVREWLEGLRAEVSAAATALGEAAPLAQTLARRVSGGYELLAELTRLSECPRDEAIRQLDLVGVARAVVQAAESRAARHGVELRLEAASAFNIQSRPQQLAVFVRSLIDHAIAATPRGDRVVVRIVVRDDTAELAVDDGGPAVAEPARADLMSHRVDPARFGRPSGLSLLVAATLAPCLGSPLGLREREGRTEAFTRLSASAP